MRNFSKGSLAFVLSIWCVGCSQVGCDALAAANTNVIGSPKNPSQFLKPSWLAPKPIRIYKLSCNKGMWWVPGKTRHYLQYLGLISHPAKLISQKSHWLEVTIPGICSRVSTEWRHTSLDKNSLGTLIEFPQNFHENLVMLKYSNSPKFVKR